MSSATRTLNYLHGDHLGSASLTTNISGTVVSQQRYKPYGEVRWSSGAGMPTDPSTDRITGPLRAGFMFTLRRRSGQRAGPANYVGSLTDYVARFYSPALGRFISADTIVQEPSDPQSFNRYACARNNSLKYVDPSGHCFLLAGLDTAVCVAVWTFVAGGTAVAAVAYESSPSAQAQSRDAALALQTAIDGAEAVYRQSLDTVQGLFVGAIMIGVIESQRGIAALA